MKENIKEIFTYYLPISLLLGGWFAGMILIAVNWQTLFH